MCDGLMKRQLHTLGFCCVLTENMFFLTVPQLSVASFQHYPVSFVVAVKPIKLLVS